MFKITYDPEAKAIYITYKVEKTRDIDHTDSTTDDINIDYDKDNNIIGVT